MISDEQLKQIEAALNLISCTGGQTLSDDVRIGDARQLLEGLIETAKSERAERAKPITPEWCKDNGGTGTNDQQWWKVAEGEWLRVKFYERGAVSVSFRGRKLYGVQTVGHMTDLLSALKGGET